MYFIIGGEVEILLASNALGNKGAPIATLGRGSFFGEMSLLEPDGRASGDVRTKGYCEGLLLPVEKFQLLTAEFPDFRQYIENVARLRVGQQMKKSKGASKAIAAFGSPLKNGPRAGNRWRSAVNKCKAGSSPSASPTAETLDEGSLGECAA